MLSMYPACFFKEEKGYSVIFPDLDHLATCGDTFEDAMSMAIDCLAGYLHTSQRDGDAIPEPSKISEINIEEISKDIYEDEPAGECVVNMVSVDVSEYAKQHFDKSVRKTLTSSVTIPALQSRPELMTLEQYEALPEDKGVEIFDGVVYDMTCSLTSRQ